MEKDECIKAHSEYAKAQFEKQKKKVWQAEKKQLAKAIETHSDLIKKCQKAFNEFVRLRDQDKPCISCGKPLGKKFDAGHYCSAGAYPELRFLEDNVHGQCVACNQHLHGNLIEYTDGLKERIGIYRYNKLRGKKHIPRKYTKTELREKITEYRAKVKALKLDKE
jgi:hypothetical protein